MSSFCLYHWISHDQQQENIIKFQTTIIKQFVQSAFAGAQSYEYETARQSAHSDVISQSNEKTNIC